MQTSQRCREVTTNKSINALQFKQRNLPKQGIPCGGSVEKQLHPMVKYRLKKQQPKSTYSLQCFPKSTKQAQIKQRQDFPSPHFSIGVVLVWHLNQSVPIHLSQLLCSSSTSRSLHCCCKQDN